jgi:p-hydroxybenzoate 3-monooxygenase
MLQNAHAAGSNGSNSCASGRDAGVGIRRQMTGARADGRPMRTQVAIVGAGPAGLVLSHLLDLDGIESVVLEKRSREYVEKRVRAGVLEQSTVDLLCATGVGERLKREALVHHGIELRFAGEGHRIALSDLTGGRSIWIYGQQEVIKDLVNARLAAGAAIHYEVADVCVDELNSNRPVVRCTLASERVALECDFIAGCDGFHGICRDAIPTGVFRTYEREYPFGWVGILAAVAPSTDELIYAFSQRGFALHSLRSPELSRLYVQCDHDDAIEDWPDERIWKELHARLARRDGWTLKEGPILEKGMTGMRSFVVEPMQYRRLFLAGDAAHIVPPTGAKGLNLAIHDVWHLAQAIVEWYRTKKTAPLEKYSEVCLRRVWRVQDFSYWMTSMLHRFPGDESGVEYRLQLARLAYVAGSRAAATSLAENYVGFPIDA